MRGRLLAAAGAAAEVKKFNAAYPPGTQIRYWPGDRAGAGLVGYTDGAAFVGAERQRAVVFVRGLRSSQRFWVPLSRVQPLVEVVPGGWFPKQVDGGQADGGQVDGRQQTVDGGMA